MVPLPPPFAFFRLLVSGWVNRQQQTVIDYLLEENRVLRLAHGRRLCLTDDQRRRLAVKSKVLGRRRLADIAGIVTPDKTTSIGTGPVTCRARLAGVLKFYDREAA